MSHSKQYMRDQATLVLELTKGFTPEQRDVATNAFNTMEDLAGYVLELTFDETQVKKDILTVDVLQANLAARINRLRMTKHEIYSTHTTIEVLRHKSFELTSVEGQLAQLMQLFALTRDGVEAIKESTEQLNHETRTLEETFGPAPESGRAME